MEKVSVLICGRDRSYNEALAEALSESEKNIFASEMSPERFRAEWNRVKDRYDILMLDEELAAQIGETGCRVVVMSERMKNDVRGVHSRNNIFKYRSVKSIVSSLNSAYYGNDISGDSESFKRRLQSEGNRMINIGIAGMTEATAVDICGAMIGRALAAAGRRTILFDLSEYGNRSYLESETEGKRSWDDLIYCLIYGKSEELLNSPEAYSSVDRSGLLFFENRIGRNSFFDLEKDEIALFYAGLRGRCRLEFSISVMPEMRNGVFLPSVCSCDIVILVNDGGRRSLNAERGMRQQILDSPDFDGSIVTLCLGGKWDTEKKSDFSVAFSGDIRTMKYDELVKTNTWKDLTRLTEFISEGILN